MERVPTPLMSLDQESSNDGRGLKIRTVLDFDMFQSSFRLESLTGMWSVLDS